MSIITQSPAPLSTAGINQMRRQFSCSGCLLSSKTHPHLCFSLVPWSLAWLYYEGGFFVPSLIQSQGITTHGRPSKGVRPFFCLSPRSPFGFFRESPCPFCAGLQLLEKCCVVGSQHPASPHVQNSKISQNAAVPRHSLWLGSCITGWTLLLRADLIANAV